ncbi:MAG: cell division protein ZapB [Fibrobacteria bacterium]
MDFSQFDALAKKVEHAVSTIDGLKQEREHLQTELHKSLEHAGNLEKLLAEKEVELAELRNDISSKSDNINLVGERIRDLVGRLDTALA